jgi:hypothetical protein
VNVPPVVALWNVIAWEMCLLAAGSQVSVTDSMWMSACVPRSVSGSKYSRALRVTQSKPPRSNW